jgi:hypothetical protein
MYTEFDENCSIGTENEHAHRWTEGSTDDNFWLISEMHLKIAELKLPNGVHTAKLG